MNGLNIMQIKKVLNHPNFICEIPGCKEKAIWPGFKLTGGYEIIEFVRDKWNEITGDIILNDLEIVEIISHKNNTFRSCEKHIHDLEIDVTIDPGGAQNILESIYRDING